MAADPQQGQFNEIPEYLRELGAEVKDLDRPVWYVGVVEEDLNFDDGEYTPEELAALKNGNGNGDGAGHADLNGTSNGQGQDDNGAGAEHDDVASGNGDTEPVGRSEVHATAAAGSSRPKSHRLTVGARVRQLLRAS